MIPTAYNRVRDTEYRFEGFLGDYLEAVTEQWIKPAPYANPAMLEMFRDRDRYPLRCMVRWAGEIAGKYLTHAVQIYRLTRDDELGRQIGRFVKELVSLQADDGYLGPWPKEYRLTGWAPNVGQPADEPNKNWAREEKWGYYLTDPVEGRGSHNWDTWGHYHVMLGLMLWYETAGDRGALRCVRRIADLMCRMFLPDGEGKRMVDTGSVEMNLAPAHSLAMLYSVTREKRYLDLALKIVDEFAATDVQGKPDNPAGDYLNAGLRNEPFYKTPKPRWESLHPIMALAELYWITGNADFRTAFENIWWSMLETDRHNNGGFTSREAVRGNPYDQRSIETCSTVAWIAMSVEMIKLTGSSIIADEIELSTLNSGLGLISQSGRWVTYDTPMDGLRIAAPHSIVFHSREGGPELNCCSVNGPRGLGMIGDWAVMRAVDGAIMVNYYGPSETTVPLQNGVRVTFAQETDYPRKGRVDLKISMPEPTAFPLKLRVPYWSSRTNVKLNGRRVNGVKAGSYLTIDRLWRDGDLVQIDLDMSLHYWAGDRECEGKVSVYRGPVLLTYDRRFNDMDPDDIPALDAVDLKGRLVGTGRYTIQPIMLMQFAAEGGRKIRLCDFASAGEAGSPYVSWLQVRNVGHTPFSQDNPLRSGRA
jgi:DUF1680 family protein